MLPIVMCGIPRSGSTLVWQIFREVLKQDFVRIHPAAKDWEPSGDDVIVMTVRDPRDVANSLFRVRISRGGEDVGGETGLDIVLNRTRRYFIAAKKLLSKPFPIFVLRYEDFLDNYNCVYRTIEVVSGTVVPEEVRRRTNVKYSLTANRIRASRLSNFNEIGEDGIHGDHIGDVCSGSWKKLPPWAQKKVASFCYPLCKEWFYV